MKLSNRNGQKQKPSTDTLLVTCKVSVEWRNLLPSHIHTRTYNKERRVGPRKMISCMKWWKQSVHTWLYDNSLPWPESRIELHHAWWSGWLYNHLEKSMEKGNILHPQEESRKVFSTSKPSVTSRRTMPFKGIDWFTDLFYDRKKIISITRYCLLSGIAAGAVELKLQGSNYSSSCSCSYSIAGNQVCVSVQTQCTPIINSLGGSASPQLVICIDGLTW